MRFIEGKSLGRYEAVVRRGVGQQDFEAVSVKRLDGAGQMELEVRPAPTADGRATFRLFASQWLPASGPAVSWNEGTAQGEFRADQLKVVPSASARASAI